EIGYGSGIYMPTLGGLCQKLYGVDVHPYPAAVSQVLAAHGIAAELTIGPAEALPYDEADFDAVVAVSSLEFVQDIDTAMAEVRRVLRPDGIAVFVMPGFSSALDVGLRVLTGHRAEDTFEGRRPGVLPAIRRRFSIDRTRRYLPAPGPAFYTAVRVSRRSHVE
ncbi:MAG TPA: class I SAM-dependent methyltransferase, partial [Acidimicrobiales bacterium]|nr:class I SAM-dependent methyltransferase [Acidimicrobiales bacterium]